MREKDKIDYQIQTVDERIKKVETLERESIGDRAQVQGGVQARLLS